MIIKILGTRGSIPTPGSEYSYFGGNTSCVQVIDDNGNYIILDLGTGLRNLIPYALNSDKKDSILLLTHFHWDHILGLPFFSPFYLKEFTFKIYGPKDTPGEVYSTISNVLHSDYFPIQIEQFLSNIEFGTFYEGKVITFGDFQIESLWVNHSSYALSYKIKSNGKTFVYLTDHESYKKHLHIIHPSLKKYNNDAELLHARLVEYVKGADLLIIDGEYKEEEYEAHKGWGHSTVNDVISLALESNVKNILFHHHNQNRTDRQIKVMAKNLSEYLAKNKIDINFSFAIENSQITL